MLPKVNATDSLAINSGELRHSITVVAAGTAGDSFGQSVNPDTWTLVRATRASIGTPTGKESARAAQISSEVSHVVKMRWTAAVIKANHRVVFGARSFIVQYVENVEERNRVLKLYCLEVDGGTDIDSIVPGPVVSHGVISGALIGVVDGVNRVFVIPGSVAPVQINIFSAGMFMTPDGDAPDYVRVGLQVTFTVAPEEGVALHADGFY